VPSDSDNSESTGLLGQQGVYRASRAKFPISRYQSTSVIDQQQKV